ncbi:HDIG domain-containing protein [Luteolibacter yonseiensis]|uniref:HDIG domain-containing protein n=1 Tax=Luteolibacter yonseiensis TaxID=1144680 RepID=A0A934R2J2_9BACT|nr:HDIG domain-containing metalloprotein [Luteolibacter yonseiensis]MBK1814335.1 HDIG domain-containing protein [Luteolibacter yonseiensis]
MGFVDAIKRWRLARQGLSSGKKRRVHSENPMVQALEDSFWVKLSLYATFVVGTAALVLNSSPDTAFGQDILKGGRYAFIIAFTALVMFHINLQGSCRRNSRVVLVLGGIFGHLLLVRAVMSLADVGAIPEVFRFFAVPFALAPMLHGVLLGRAVASFSAVYVTLIGCLLAPEEEVLGYLILSLVAGMTSVLLAYQVRKRLQLLQAGIYIGAVTLVTGLVLGRLDLVAVFGPQSMDHLQLLGNGSAAAFGTAVLTALLISGLLPLFEGAFHLTTDISWLELSDLNHKLLRQMQLEAPGTFHHSLVVASLAEAAAEKVGANAPMCRVCSYFHDVGKLKKPGYFIENQHDGGENPHNTLTPTMSSLIIIAHVKDGVDLAVKNKLNPRIIDVIQEHHGDSLVYYFYRRAQEQKKAEMEKVDRRLENPEDLPMVEEKNFRYPGPRPSTRESGIISLADSVESASRSLQKPTPAKIRALVDDIVRTRINDGQLDACPLTLRELALVKDSFSSTLRSMLHSRIDYPKDDSASATKRLSSDPSHGGRVIPMPKRA